MPRAASRSGLSIWLVSRRVDALTHSLKLTNVHNNMHLFFHTLIWNQSATWPCSSRSNGSLRAASAIDAQMPHAPRVLFPDCEMLAAAQHAPLLALCNFSPASSAIRIGVCSTRPDVPAAATRMAVAEQRHAQSRLISRRQIRTAAHRCNGCNRRYRKRRRSVTAADFRRSSKTRRSRHRFCCRCRFRRRRCRFRRSRAVAAVAEPTPRPAVRREVGAAATAAGAAVVGCLVSADVMLIERMCEWFACVND